MSFTRSKPTVLCWIILVASALHGPAAVPSAKAACITLAKPEYSETPSSDCMRVLARELFRQALLITARDEFGLATRDPMLREDGPAQENATRLRLELKVTGPQLNLVATVHAQTAGQEKRLWSSPNIPIDTPVPLNYELLAAQAEALSREGFVQALQSAGFSRSARARSSQDIPDEIEQRLGKLSLVEQFAAVRQLHQWVRDKGESPALLGGLVRGYAHLSLLTESHWNVSHKVFLARSLLYAQRMAAAPPKNALARAHVAYALALGGLHGAALAESAQARLLAGSTDLPEWLEMVEAVCRFDNPKLEELAKGKSRCADLAGLVRLLQCESKDIPPKEAEMAAKLLARNPDCLRLNALVSRLGPIDQQHLATAASIYSLDEIIRKQVPRLTGLPPDVNGAIAALSALDAKTKGKQDWRTPRVNVVRALVKAGSPQVDSGEPSWTVLGRFIEEEFFTATFERVWFVRHRLCADTDKEVDALFPLVAEHPCVSFLKLCRIPPGEERDQMVKLLGEMVVSEPDVQMAPMLSYVAKAESAMKKNARQDVWSRYYAGEDDVSRDLVYDCTSENERLVVERARRLLEISPYHPIAAANLVKNDWKFARAHLAEWEARFSGQWPFVRELARHYQDEGPPELAEKYTKKLIELAPELKTYQALAALYRKKGDSEKYVQTLQDGLKEPETDLGHSRVRVQIAEYYMDKGDYDAALPYAKKAAESYAGDCLMCLARCYEGLGDMKLAEKWVRACSERYRPNGEEWFFWCKRTGCGDVQAAAALAAECLAPRADRGSDDRERYAVFLVLSNEPAQALEVFRKDFDKNHNPNSGLHAALIAYKMNNRKLHDELLSEIVAKSGKDKKKIESRRPKIELARLLQESARNGGGSLDRDRIEQLIKAAPDGETINMLYFAGRFLEVHGDQSQANAYLLRAARSTASSKHTRILARDRCRQLGLRIETQPEETGPASASE